MISLIEANCRIEYALKNVYPWQTCGPVPLNFRGFLREFYELKFSLAFRAKRATEFQNFFSEIMACRYLEHFQTVKPYGNKGDMKCDGYQPNLKRVFQCYAPERIKVRPTITKIRKDFAGAVKHWKQNLAEWVFVHNQPEGIPPQIVLELRRLEKSKKVKICSWGEQELRTEFFRLGEADQSRILGPTPTYLTFTRLQIADLVHVVSAIAQKEPPASEPVHEVPAGKLNANSLSVYVQDLLKTGARKSRLVRELFEKWHDPEMGDRLASAFRARYNDLRSARMPSDEIYKAIWVYAGGVSQATQAGEAAVFAVIAFLFEECEIFETPQSEATN